ncbi:hypothetical protein [Actinomadura litoris]|uniref:Uncharacterized protein n=1 Tax=Actinomadura litoris TaxID=2678616 RepID=A0A7K1LAK4_9ACTN|nr:hypothetical protein [Actinomadura litoris]MUN41444.1 hypothetical protein [Actinomadura litoris]
MPTIITLPVEISEDVVRAAAQGRVRQWVGPEIAEDVVRAVLADVLGEESDGQLPEQSRPDADEDAVAVLMRKYLGVDPATVSVRKVRADLGGARHDRAVRVKDLWTARYAAAFGGRATVPA